MTRSPAEQVRSRRINIFRPRFVPDLRTRLELLLLEARENPAGTITGLVFDDINANARFDPPTTAPTASGVGTYPVGGDTGIAGVTVLAFNSAGTQVAQATTAADGTYTLDTGTTTGPYRIQFVNIPPGAVAGPVSNPTAGAGVTGPTVQFVQDGGATGVNLGVVFPGSIAGSDNPLLFTAVYRFGNPLDPSNPNADDPVIISFPWNAGAQVGTPDANGNTIPPTITTPNGTKDPATLPNQYQVTIPYSAVGTVLGMGFNPTTAQLYAADYMKRHTGFGLGDGGVVSTGAIYSIQTPPPGSNQTVQTATLLVDLNTAVTSTKGGVPTAGANYRVGYTSEQNYVTDGMVRTLGATDPNDPTHLLNPQDQGWDAVGKLSLGGLDVMPDGSRLFVMNLFDRQLYSVPLNPDGTANVAGITRYVLPVPGSVTGVNGSNPLGDLRPFAVQYYNGKIYVGAVNSAESTDVYTDLGAGSNGVHRIGVSSWDPSKLRAYVFVFDPATNTFSQTPVVDISLDYARGEVDPGIPAAWNPWTSVLPQSTPNFPNGIPKGAFPQPMLSSIAFDAAGNITLGLRDRSGDQFGNVAPADPTLANTSVQDFFFGIPAGDILKVNLTPTGYVLEENGTGPTGDGPGHEFYSGDNQTTNDTPTTPTGNRHDEVSLGAVLYLPGSSQIASLSFNPNPDPDVVNRGGVRWYDTATGALDRAYEVFYAPNGLASGGQFGLFAKANGLGELVAQTVAPVEIGDRVWFDTNRNGVQDAGEDGIGGLRIDLLAADGVTVLATATTDANGYFLFSSLAGTSTASTVRGLPLSAALGYKLRLDMTQPGVSNLRLTRLNATGPADPDAIDNDAVQSGSDAIIDVPAGSLSPAGTSNTTFDFGVTDLPNLAIGDTVWYDRNNDGVHATDGSEPGIAGVSVQLVDTSSGLVVRTTTTDAQGQYIFTNLEPGRYVVQILVDPTSGYRSSTGTGTADTTTGPFEPSPTTDNNDEDHGTAGGPGVIEARSVVLTDPLVTPNPDDYNSVSGVANLRQDFGLWKPLTIGDTVWVDTNNDGKLDSGESGIGGVTVQLFSGGVKLKQTTTAGDGTYHFTNLFAGTYQVQIIAPGGYRSSTGAGLTPATNGPFEPAPPTDNNNEDHGTAAGGSVIAANPVTLVDAFDQPLGNPDDYNGSAHTANLRQDFGLWSGTVPLSIGDTVWNDVNNDGVHATGGSEPGISGVAVQLIHNGTVVAQQTTDANGHYLFTGLTPGTYQVAILVNPADGWISSTGAGNSGATTGKFEPSPATDNNDEDHGTTGGSTTVGGQTFTLISARNVTLTDPFATPNPDASASGAGTANLRQDFGLWRPLSIGNVVFGDDNNDGVFDPSRESGLPGVKVDLLDGGGNVIRSTTTSGGGGYLFAYLLPGQYQVRVTVPSDRIYSSSGDGTIPQVTKLNVIPPQPTGPYEPAKGNTGDNTDHGTKQGSFAYGPVLNLAAGSQPTGETPTPDGIANPARDQDSDLTQDFGFIKLEQPVLALPSISGHVFIDGSLNGAGGAAPGTQKVVVDQEVDGFRIAGLQPVPGTLLTLTGVLDDGTTYTAATRTDRTGAYVFANLPDAGIYSLTMTPPPGQLFNGLTYAGDLGGTPGDKTVTAIRIDQTDHGINYDFSVFQTMTVYGNVYYDVNRNGVRDDPAVEVGIPNTQITISGTAFAGTIFARPLVASDSSVGLTVLTNALGQYIFPVLPPGIYNLNEKQPAGYDDGLESTLDPQPASNQPVVGNDVFTGIRPSVSRFRGPFNFGEVLSSNQPPFNGPDDSKRNFIGTPAPQPPDTVPEPIGGGTAVPVPDVQLNQKSGILVGDPAKPTVVAVGTGVGFAPLVRVFDYSRGFESFRITAYGADFTGGVRTAVGDLTGDGIPDIVTVPGPGGGPIVKVFDGSTGQLITSFLAYEPDLRTGLFVALGDVNGDGTPDIVLGPDVGGGTRVAVFDGKTFQLMKNFFAFDDATRVGVRVAAADFNGDGKADLVAATGPGQQTLIRVYDGAGGPSDMLFQVVPFGPSFTGGAFVAVGDVNGDGAPDIIAGADVGNPAVYAFSGKDQSTIFSQFVYAMDYHGGVRVAAADLNDDGRDDVIITPGQDGGAVYRALDAVTATEIDSFNVFGATYNGGLYPSATPFKK
jgi:hypothetical protein